MPRLCLSLATTAAVKKGTTKCGPKLESNIFTAANGTVYLGTRILPGQNGNIAFGSNPYLLTHATSNYNSLQANLKHTTTSWDVLLSYTYGRSFDDASALTDSTNPLNPRVSYGLSSYDVTHYLVASYEWHLPFANYLRNRAAKLLVGGWSISGITRMATGTPVGMSDSEDYSLTGLGDVPLLQSKCRTAASESQSENSAIRRIRRSLPPYFQCSPLQVGEGRIHSHADQWVRASWELAAQVSSMGPVKTLQTWPFCATSISTRGARRAVPA